jgi:hypothetical protein
MPKTVFDIGEKIGFLTVVAELPKYRTHRVYLSRCDCGAQKPVRGCHLQQGQTISCGCFSRRSDARHRTGGRVTHGESRVGKRSAEYRTWLAMRKRCLNSNYPDFKYYGGRGIKICDAWQSYEQFLADMGRKPSAAHSIDRKEVNGNYEPSNCRWATPSEQALNRRNSLAYRE